MAVEGQLKEHTNIKVKQPDLYKVVMFNDDFTPMEFVVEICLERSESAASLEYFLAVASPFDFQVD